MRGLTSAKKGLAEKENAVSEVMGVALLLGIVVIMLSFEGAFVFSRSGPDDLPHAKLQEWMDTTENKIYLKHCTGEPIKIEETEISANINGKKYVCNSSNVYKGAGNNSHWELGEILEINTSNEWGLDIKDYDEIDLFIIDTPTKEPIQKVRLTTDDRDRKRFVGWITPQGDVTDTSNGSAQLSHVQIEDWVWFKTSKEQNETAYTVYYPPTAVGNETDPNVYQEFDFGINPCYYGFRPGDSFSNVTLKIAYRTNDNSLLKIELRFYDIDDPSKWTSVNVDLPENNAFNVTSIDLTNRINTTEDLSNFKIRFQAVGNADEHANKEINIDYLGLWIE